MSSTDTAPSDGGDASSAYSGRTPEQIETEIEQTRERLAQTLDALQSKLSPRERLQAAAESARVKGGRLLRSVAQAATPDITTLIRMDHAHVIALFRRLHPTTSLGRKRALVESACLALEVHTQLEEEIFYPALRQAAGASEILDKSVPEHEEIRRLIRAMHVMEPQDPAYDDTFHMLMRTVLHHVADEESLLLPQAEELMPDRLGALGMEMTKRRIELLKPHLGSVAVTTARSFPVLSAAAVIGVLALGVLAFKPRAH